MIRICRPDPEVAEGASVSLAVDEDCMMLNSEQVLA
jgi:hypothetical protein